ncbi:MAG: tRNA uridine-5-carboxymethylaminomethyl(34) synthesis GTPase MnmE [Lachnospiraceae bacterium]|nr:tRNA uridine-5-carboxymethylaminomethyl(34) synthesis GTPase MnmE [Lachnospiraceae bacterium]
MAEFFDDTIAAISTAMTASGIGIVRVSGPDAFEIADRVYKGKNGKRLIDQKANTIHYGWVTGEQGEILDEVLVMLMKAPHSYTGEHTVEIDCHGGVIAMRKILEQLLNKGARPAEPGEFTKRAFLNGRIDLSQAEAVMDIISAKNEYALKSSVKQLQGSVQKEIRFIREKLIYQIAFIESALDDPEHISVDGYGEELLPIVQEARAEILRLIASADKGKMISEGIKTVIVGKPNAGKSSLLNVLSGEEKAIVTDIAGTTRDVVEETINVRGITLRLLDTAGIRESANQVERIGIQRAREHAKDADLILYVVDGSAALDENDEEIMQLIRDKKCIVLLNKTDLELCIDAEELKEKTKAPVIGISARENQGIDALEECIREMFFQGELSFNDEVMITNVRHKHALEEASQSLVMVENSILDGMPEDFYTIDLMGAYEALGRILGESLGENLVNEIFSKFCTGK